MNSSELTTGARIVWVQILVTRSVSRRASQRMPWKPVIAPPARVSPSLGLPTRLVT